MARFKVQAASINTSINTARWDKKLEMAKEVNGICSEQAAQVVMVEIRGDCEFQAGALSIMSQQRVKVEEVQWNGGEIGCFVSKTWTRSM